MPSIVDPAIPGSGASTATRGLLKLIEDSSLQARIHCMPIRHVAGWRRRLRQAACLAGSVVSPWPAKIAFTYRRRYARRIRRLGRTRDFGLALLNGSDLLWLLDELPSKMPVVLVAHNIEHLLYTSQIRELPWRPWPSSRLLRHDQERLRKYETSGWRRVAGVVFLSGRDALRAREIEPRAPSLVVPPVFDYPPAARPAPRAAADRLRLGFLGNFGWWPNRHGLRWFLHEVFPHLEENIELHLFGSGSENAAPHHPRIVKHGFVADLAAVWSGCDVMICPLSAGGGVAIKLAEALYNGMPALATSFAAQGLPPIDDPAVAVLDRAEDWVRFLRSRRALELAGCRVSAELSSRFSAGPYRDVLGDFLRNAARNGGPPATPPLNEYSVSIRS